MYYQNSISFQLQGGLRPLTRGSAPRPPSPHHSEEIAANASDNPPRGNFRFYASAREDKYVPSPTPQLRKIFLTRILPILAFFLQLFPSPALAIHSQFTCLLERFPAIFKSFCVIFFVSFCFHLVCVFCLKLYVTFSKYKSSLLLYE